MRVTLHVPGVLRALADDQRTLIFDLPPGATVAELLAAVAARAPGLHARAVDELGAVRRHVNVFVEDESIRQLKGTATTLRDGQEIWVIPAVSGG